MGRLCPRLNQLARPKPSSLQGQHPMILPWIPFRKIGATKEFTGPCSLGGWESGGQERAGTGRCAWLSLWGLSQPQQERVLALAFIPLQSPGCPCLPGCWCVEPSPLPKGPREGQ
jgi:hypothetical protein